MACDTLKNTKERFKELGLLGDANNIEPDNYNEVDRLIKTYQSTAETKYGLKDKLFRIITLTRDDVAGINKFTTHRLQYNTTGFAKLDELVENYNQAEAEQREIEEFVEQYAYINRDSNQFFDEEGNVYPTAEDAVNAIAQEEAQFDAMIANTNPNLVVVSPHYEDYVAQKQKLVGKLEKTITKLYNEKKTLNTPHINRKITRYNRIKENLEKDIHEFTTANDKNELISRFFDKDFDLIASLLQEPNLENVFLAKDLFNYIKNVADIRLSNIQNNKLFNLPVNSTFDTEVNDLISSLHERINSQERLIEEAVDALFLELLAKNEQKLQELHPGKTLDQIKNELLSNLQDISLLESAFFTQGENLYSANNLIEQIIKVEYEKEQLRQQSKSQKLIQELDALIPQVEKELERLGKKVTAELGKIVYTGYDYRFLYQTDSRDGNYQSSLIGKFSLDWQNFDRSYNREHNQKMFIARQNRDGAEVEKLLINKFADLDNLTEFVDFRKLHDIYSDGEYVEFKQGTDQEAEAYKQEIIKKIGQEEYNNLIDHQKELFDKYYDEVDIAIKSRLMAENVQTVSQLTQDAQDNLALTIKRLNPASFLDSFYAGHRGMIEYKRGTQSNERPSYLKYNSYIPKATSNTGVDTKFYDSNFDFIESNPTLYNFWKVINRSTQLINENLIDSNLRLNKNSLLLFKKQFSESLVDKSAKDLIKTGIGEKAKNIKEFTKKVIKDLASAKLANHGNNQGEVILPQEIKSFESEVINEFNLLKTDVANIVKGHVANNTKISWNKLSLEQQAQMLEITGMSTAQDFLDKLRTKDMFTVGNLVTFSEVKVMEQQTLNTPLMLKTFLELSAEHRARTKVLNEIHVYNEKASNVLNAKNTAFSKENTQRIREGWRRNMFFNKVALNDTKLDHTGNISKKLIQLANKNEFTLLGKHFFKNFTPEEKKIYSSAVTRLEALEVEIPNAPTDSVRAVLYKEKAELEARIRMLGKDYLISALFNNAVNEFGVKIGLGYNVVANLKNKLQGMTALLTRDGEFWTKGNIYPVQHFVSLNKLRFLRPAYKEEWDKATLFIKQLNLIQDGTNELQRAESKLKAKTRWLSPMYGTEVVEYYNQVPGILAMAMDLEITDVNGVKHPFFDGSSLVAYNNENGVLKLKDEFRTPENIQHFETMDSEDMVNWKLNVENMTRSLHGDYSKTGVTLIKGSIWSKPMMMFKTWLGRYITSRLRYNQKNIITGKTENGYLLSSFINKKTSFAGGLMLGITGAVGIASSSPMLVAIPLILGTIAAGKAKYHYNKRAQLDPSLQVDDADILSITEQTKFILKSISYGMIEIPVNSLAGREVINSPTIKGDLTPQEMKDIRLMVRNMQNTIFLIMVKLLIQAMFQDDDETEPKGEEGSYQRQRYLAQKEKRERERGRNNFIENTVTGLLHETSLILEPNALLSTMGSKNGLEAPLIKIQKLSTALGTMVLHPEKDEILKGPRAGQSKSLNAARKVFLPSLFRDIGNDTWRAGAESSMETEWINNEVIDGIFESDYKEDKRNAKKTRAQEELHVLEEFERERGIDVSEESIEFQEQLTKEIKQLVKDTYPNPDRGLYDDEQNKK